jgi:hypothetical protein
MFDKAMVAAAALALDTNKTMGDANNRARWRTRAGLSAAAPTCDEIHLFL